MKARLLKFLGTAAIMTMREISNFSQLLDIPEKTDHRECENVERNCTNE